MFISLSNRKYIFGSHLNERLCEHLFDHLLLDHFFEVEHILAKSARHNSALALLPAARLQGVRKGVWKHVAKVLAEIFVNM